MVDSLPEATNPHYQGQNGLARYKTALDTPPAFWDTPAPYRGFSRGCCRGWTRIASDEETSAMRPKSPNRPRRASGPARADRTQIPRSPRLCCGKWARRVVCGALGCLLLSGCSVFGGKKENLSPGARIDAQHAAAVSATAAAAKKNQSKDSGSSWLPTWMQAKDPPPPKGGVGDFLNQKQSRWADDNNSAHLQ
jgi:hypothetical protein